MCGHYEIAIILLQAALLLARVCLRSLPPPTILGGDPDETEVDPDP